MRGQDFRIINLETLLANKEKHTPIKKSGSNLICAPNNILFLETLHTDVCTLANNHTGDFGEGAVIDTLKLLDKHSIGRYVDTDLQTHTEYFYRVCAVNTDGICGEPSKVFSGITGESV